jgi:hypothetical protein
MEGMTVNSLNYENGKPGKVDIMGDGKGDIKGTVKDYVEKGYNPDKIFIDGQPASDVFQKDGKISFEGKNKKEVPNVRMGFYGIQKLPVKLNDEQVAEMNKTRQLPEGYQLMFCPKRTYSVNFIPAGEDPARLENILINYQKALKS